MALISHIQASELAFENGNRKFLISEILDFSYKKRLIFDGVFSQVDCIFGIFCIYDTPHDFLRAFQICLQNFYSSIRADFRGGGYKLPPPHRKSSKIRPTEIGLIRSKVAKNYNKSKTFIPNEVT